MSTRTRTSTRHDEESLSDYLDDGLYSEDVTDDDIEAFLEERDNEKEPGFWNLPTVAGMSIISVGVAYLLQQMGLSLPLDFTTLVSALPWFAGALIILLGFGVLSWTPNRKKRRERAKRRAKTSAAAVAKERTSTHQPSGSGSSSRRRLVKSRTNKKLAGVAGGLGEYFGVDPTLIRIGFVIATIFGGGFPAIPVYIVLAIIMSNADKKQQLEQKQNKSREERIRVVRDS